MDGLSITKAINIIKARYLNQKVTKVTVTEDSLCMGIYSENRASLLVRVTGGKPSVHTVFTQTGVPDQELSRLNGGEITEIGCRMYDRVFWMDIAKRRPSGKIETHRLIFELIGKMANALMANEEGMVTWTFCKNNPDADREMGVGKVYQLPRSNKQQTLEKYSTADFAELLGFYPVTVKHAQAYMENNYSFDEVAVLIRESLESEPFWLDDKGKLLPFKPFTGGTEIAYDKIHELTDKQIEKKRDEGIRNRLMNFFQKQADKYERLKQKLEKELAEAGRHHEESKKAELIKANIYKLKDAKGRVELDEYTESGVNKVAYDIPESFDVNAEVQKLYKRAEKLKRSLPLLENRLAEVENNIDSSLEQLYFIKISADDDELRELAMEMKKKAPKQQNKQVNQKQFEKIEIGGGTAYIGRNSVSNHRLVFQFANPGDWWFHAQKIPSAHLIFRKDGNITEEEVVLCAQIVAGLSKARQDLKVTVDYTQKKHVKKPKNTPPGFVIYHRFFSVTVEPKEI